MSKRDPVQGGSLSSLLEKLSGASSAKVEDQEMEAGEENNFDKSQNFLSAQGASSVKYVRSSHLNTPMEYQEETMTLEENFPVK